MLFSPVQKRDFRFRGTIVFLFFLTLLLLPISFPFIGNVYAQTPTPTAPASPTPTGGVAPTPGGGAPALPVPTWAFDPEVTEVGKNADRGRQLLYWVLSHPSVYSASVLATIWGFSRNVVYALFALVIVTFGLGLMLSRRKGGIGPIFSGIASPISGLNLSSILMKVATLLLYTTFSYIAILALIQISEVVMRFFITHVGGQNLFNVIFAGVGNSEANYLNFVGYKDINPLNREMVNTSIFLVKLTTMTYNVMSVIVIMRAVILWFLLAVSPFLAILIPFIFIRNVGWIWIGVFFQWLFYGPLFALFLAAITNIWVYGIPYAFDFSRVNRSSGQIYKTAINILYGGPAQTLSPGNSANYVDTFAEYVIALVMLWVAIILPWLLLRIFRDYCCSIISSSYATLQSIFDRMRQYPLPPPSSAPPSGTTISGMAVELPFRQKVTEKVREVERMRIEDIKKVSEVSTQDLTHAMNISVSRLADVSRFEMNDLKRMEVRDQLDKLANPQKISSSSEREKYLEVRQELHRRALRGDTVAKSILTASEDREEVLVRKAKDAVEEHTKERVAQREMYETRISPQMMSAPEVAHIAVEVGIEEAAVREVLSSVSQMVTNQSNTVTYVAETTGLPENKVREIFSASSTVLKDENVVREVANNTQVSESKVREVLQAFQSASVPSSEVVQTVAKQTDVSDTKVKEILMMTSTQLVSQPVAIEQIARTVELPKEKVKEVLEAVQHVSGAASEVVSKTAVSSQVSESKTREILAIIASTIRDKAQEIHTISEKVGVSESKVKDVLTVLPVAGSTTSTIYKEIAQKENIPEIKVQEIISFATKTMMATSQTITNISQKVGVPESTVREVLETTGKLETAEKQIEKISDKTGMPKEKIQAIMQASISAPKTSVSPPPSPAVTLEDYEEVKNMWLNHYRMAPVPVSETVKTREDWLEKEEKKLTNISHLLGSSDANLKQKGFEQVSEILPFLLLGGFSESEILTYIKAKLEADKQIQKELEAKKEGIEEAKKEKEEEETLLEVKREKSAEDKKEQHAETAIPIKRE